MCDDRRNYRSVRTRTRDRTNNPAICPRSCHYGIVTATPFAQTVRKRKNYVITHKKLEKFLATVAQLADCNIVQLKRSQLTTSSGMMTTLSKARAL